MAGIKEEKKIYLVGIYCRLSKDDGTENESASIATQKSILTDYVKKQGWHLSKTYVDDGYSGTNFQRPSFQNMIKDIENGLINCVITKDLSRLGRNYLDCGLYLEVFFPENNVWYIAVNDGVDTLNKSAMDITPFRNILNEMYSADVSVKIKSAYRARFQQGKFMGTYAPYGYIKDPADHNHLLIDDKVAHVVREIFDLALAGNGISKIRNHINKQHVLRPAAYAAEQGAAGYERYFEDNEENRYIWSENSVRGILSHIPMDEDILRKWLKSGYIETGKLFPTDLGSPQGSSISPTICNMVLDGLEIQIKKKYHKTKVNGKAYFPKVNFVRYADDFIVTGESRELLENGVLPVIREFLLERGLELSEEKTVITHIEDGFDFLGSNIRWYKDKLLTKPSKKNYKAIVGKIREIIKKNPSMKQEDLIRKLNPVIRGWVNFQKYNVSSQAFERFDFDVWRCLWQWCRRRHPKKSHKWIAKKYFRRVGTRSWTFSVKMSDSFELNLIYATDTNIVRWLKTKSEATPFDDRFTGYFEERDTERMFREIKGRKKLNALYKAQKGICPICGGAITVEEGYRIHEAVGNDYKITRILVDAGCHRKLHYSKNVDEPALVTQGL